MRRILDISRSSGPPVSQPFTPGPSATLAHLRAAQERERLLRTELARVRAAATAWRNGLAGLLAALAGFSLIKGQSDVNRVAMPWSAAVGVLLLVAFIGGAVGAVSLIRAANGRPSVVSARDLLPRSAADHIEALASAAALRRGIGLTLACAALLVTAVGATWYSPSRLPPALQVTTPVGTECGSLVQLDHGRLTINTGTEDVTLDLTQPSTVRPVTACAPP